MMPLLWNGRFFGSAPAAAVSGGAVSGGGYVPTSGDDQALYEADYATRPWAGWATWPNAVYDAASDKTFISWTSLTPFEVIKVTAYNHAAGTWEGPYVVDNSVLQNEDHGSPALCLLSDGRLVVFYGSHQTSQYWAISAQSGGSPDITTWTAQTPLSGNYTYPKPVNIDAGSGAGTVYLFMREGNTSNYPFILKTAAYTSGGALSFSADSQIVDLNDGSGAVCYAAEVREDASDNIEILMSGQFSGVRQHVYYFKYITATGAVENLSGGTSTAAGSLPVDLTNANANYREVTSSGSNATGGLSWCRDTNSYLHILYGDDTTNPWDIRHQYHNGTSWSTSTVAFTVNGKSGTGFVEIWSINAATAGQVEAFYPANNNGSFTGRGGDDIATKVWDGSWGAETIIVTGDEVTAVGHPVSVKNADPDIRALFTEVSQDTNDTSRDLMKRWAFGDTGFISWPTLTDQNYQETVLLLNFNGSDAATSTTDASPWANLHPVTFNGNAQLDTAQKKFGTASLLLDGTGDYLTIPQHATDAASYEFKVDTDTIEFFFRPNELGRTQVLLATRNNPTNNGFQIIQASSNVIQATFYNTAGSAVLALASTATVTTGQWYYGAVKRKTGGTYGTGELWLDGTMEDSGSFTGTPGNGDTSLWVGRIEASSTLYHYNGWIDSIRWTKLVDRDVSVVPTSEFSAG